MTPIIESVRGLLTGTPVGNTPWLAITWCGGILVVSTALRAGLPAPHLTIGQCRTVCRRADASTPAMKNSMPPP